MIHHKITLPMEKTLHARPVAALAKVAQNFEASCFISYEGQVADARSPMSLLALGIVGGSTITITVSGPDERAAFDALFKVITSSVE